MDSKTFGIAANKLMYFIFNYDFKTKPMELSYGVTKTIPAFFEVFDINLRTHLYGKWDAYYGTYGAYGVFAAFYGELDATNRAKVLKWVNENYELADANGISLTTLEK